jgi:hypothetical protein
VHDNDEAPATTPGADLEVQMRRSTTIAATATGAVLMTGLLIAPALAGNWTPPWSPAGAGTTAGVSSVAAAGYGRAAVDGNPAALAGSRWNDEPLAGLEQGTLTDQQKNALAAMAEEEKLAHDVYVKLAATSGDNRFTRIATSEANHVTEIQALLSRYGIADPTAGQAEGQFTSDAFQTLYDDLVTRGDGSVTAALEVGRQVETLDIGDLDKAADGVTAPDVLAVYQRLTSGSESHLAAFNR